MKLDMLKMLRDLIVEAWPLIAAASAGASIGVVVMAALSMRGR